MSNLFFKYKWELALIASGMLLLGVADFFLQMSSQFYIFADSDNYLVAAKNLMVHHRGHDYRPILIAFVYGIPYLFGADDAFVFVFSFYVNLFCWLATGLLIYKIGVSFVRPRIAFLAGILFYTTIGTASLLYHLLSENLYTFCIVLVFWFLLQFNQTKRFWYLAVALSLLIASMLIRPGSKWIAVVFCLYYVRILWKNYRHSAMIFFYGSWLLVLVQCVGLYHQFGNFTISYIDSVTYYNYLGSKALCLKEGKEYAEINNPRAAQLFALKTRGEMVEMAKTDFITQLKTNKINLIKAYFSDVFNNTSSGSAAVAVLENKHNTSFFEASKTFFFSLSKWQNRIFTIVGILLSLVLLSKSYKKVDFFSMMAFYILYIVAVSGVTFTQGDRFHMVFYPMVIVLFFKWLKERGLVF